MSFIFGLSTPEGKRFIAMTQDGILMSSRHLTLIIPSFTNSYLSFFLFLLYSFFFVLFGYELECERLVPITMYGDENKDG